MKRNINIIDKDFITNIQGYDSVHVNNLESIANSSVDNAYCGLLNLYEDKEYRTLLNILLSKLRPQGILILKLVDYKSLCQMYLQNTIDSSAFFSAAKNSKSAIDISDIMNSINRQIYTIVKIDKQNGENNIIIQRTSI